MEKILYSYKLHSHPDKLLKDHLLNVKDIGINLYKRENFNQLLNEDVLKAILLFHDFGKASVFFQDKLFNRKQHNVNLTYHSDISALACMFYLEKEGYPVSDFSLAFLVIKKHHGNINSNLDDLFRIDEEKKEFLEEIINNIHFDEIKEIYQPELHIDGLKDNLYNNISNLKIRRYRNAFKKELNNHFETYTRLNFYFSILVYSDKQDCLFNKKLSGKKNIFNNFSVVDDFKNKSFKNVKKNPINKIREKAYREVENNINQEHNIFSINLPTGSGKTLTAFNAALKLLNKDSSLERIIYCLPYTSIIDQNAEVFQQVLETSDNSILIKHHYLTEPNYSASFYKDEIFNDNQAENLIESWESKIIVTTFYQFLNTLFSGSNRLLKKLNKIQNSIVILDEVQSIPRKYWLLIKTYLKYLSNLLNIKLFLVTATMPLIFSEDENEIIELAKSKKKYFNYFNRISLDVSQISQNKKMNISEFSNLLFKKIQEDKTKSFLIILNTINSSLNINKNLSEKKLNIIYLSSNIIPKHRIQRINDIKKAEKRFIVISTQVVEAGVDIDFDIVYRDFAPLDSIFQACGRCNRNGKKENKGRVNIIKLVNESGREYSHFIYDTVNLSRTSILFKDHNIIKENEFFSLSHEYFNEMKIATESNTSHSILTAMKNLNYREAFYDKNSFKLIEDNFLSVPVFFEIDEEATQYLNEYRKLMEEETSFERNIKMKKLFVHMNQYTINVSKKFLTEKDTNGFVIIENDEIKHYYSPETGFIRPESAKDFFF